VRRMIDLNAELVTLCASRRDQIRTQIVDNGRRRDSLESYRGPVAVSPVFLDRTG
jgi:hypothetical protein